ncbi:MAG: PHB depolymerase family esterase [Candidatus Omnitrophota bacterium]
MNNRTAFFTVFFLLICLPLVMAGVLADKAQERKQQRDEKKVAAEQAKTGVVTCSLTHQGLNRTYDVHVPASYIGKTPVPLVMVFHGGGGDSAHMRIQSGMNEKADQEGFIVVYPQGTGKKIFGRIKGTWNAGKAGGGTAYNNKIDDIGFINAMLNDLESKYNIDKDRIYSTGHSMGGMITYRLACESADRIAAIAPVATSLVADRCEPSRPVAVLHFQGTKDRPVPYEGGVSDPELPRSFVVGGPYRPTRETIAFWSQKDQCSKTSQVTYQKGDVICETQGPCADNTEVTLCTVKGGGHTWPGSPRATDKKWWKKLVGETTQDISATDTMWEFFKRHPKSKTEKNTSV